MWLLWTVLLIICSFVLLYQRASRSVILSTIVLYLLLFSFLSSAHLGTILSFWIIAGALAVLLGVPKIRQVLITGKVFKFYCKAMPAISETEAEVLNAGGVGWEAELFTGMPNWNTLKAMPGPRLNEEERSFIEGPVQELCEMLDPWKITEDRNLPPEVWEFLKKHGFLGLIIPKEYGGKAFSALGHSEVIAKVASINLATATVISVPNSLGPAELILRYGTLEQKNHYLPRLAKGLEIPCFALTSPTAGSDAGSITDSGVICRRFNNGVSELGIRLNWNKRYITLAPVATLLGLAFKLYDPEHLLGTEENLGITCALIPAQTEGVIIGRRHLPLNAAFPNGPTQGHDVFIPLDWIIGGVQQVGQGWRMLMECLAAGRGISLPSLTCGGAKKSALASGAYVRIRRQFHVAIESFGGVEEVLARMAAHMYLLEATRLFTVNALDHGAPSAIAAAISKYHCTELGRDIIKSSMDLHGGKGICMGPHNYLAQAYIETPIGITVEGANILTRSMIIFGQGSLRAHPYLLAELQAAKNNDLKAFDKALFGHIISVKSNFVRTWVLAIFSKSSFRNLFCKKELNQVQYFKRAYTRLNWFAAAFALLTDFSVLVLQSKLKFKEKISGRLGDILSYLYMASAVLNYHRDSKQAEEELPVTQWVLEDLFFKIQCSIQELLQNLAYAKFLRFVIFPRGLACKPPSDHLGAAVADLLSTPSVLRDRIAESTYIAPKDNNLVGKMNAALGNFVASEVLEHQLYKALRKGLLKESGSYQEQVESAVAAQILKPEEAQQLLELNALRELVINVDDFDSSEISSG